MKFRGKEYVLRQDAHPWELDIGEYKQEYDIYYFCCEDGVFMAYVHNINNYTKI